MTPAQRAIVEAKTGSHVVRISALAGGDIASVARVDLADGTSVVAKTGGGGQLDLEGFMLGYLAATGTIPVPQVVHAEPDMLVMALIETAGGIDRAAQTHAADLLAGLHAVTGPRFGFERDTLIGPLDQPNPEMSSWCEFFRDHRLFYMGGLAHEAGQLPSTTFRRLRAFCDRLDRHIGEPARPSLIHGDMWGGNVLTCRGRVSAFIDPAIYFADPEIELAFSTLFNTFGDTFFQRYAEHHPIAPGFFEERRDIYNLYPLLVHTRLFGGGYVGSVDRILRRFV